MVEWRAMRRSCLALLLVLLLLPSVPVWAGTFVYVSLSGENRIAVFRLDESSGALEAAGSLAVDGSPGSIALDPSGRRLYVALRSTGKLAALRADPRTGELTVAHETTVGESSPYVITAAGGRYLLSAYYRAGKVMVHSIGDDGALSAAPLQTIDTAPRAHCIRPDPSGKFVFVPHTAPNAVFQFRLDADAGRLVANTPPEVETPPDTGPRHIFFHPTAAFAYVANEQGSSVTAYRFDRASGTLDPLQTLSTLPEGFEKRNSCADVEVTPDGRFVYVSNRGHDSLAGFRVDAADGTLTPIGRFPTEQTPRSFNIDPTGRYIVAAGQASGRLATYRLEDDGQLNRLTTYPVGDGPAWVLIVKYE